MNLSNRQRRTLSKAINNGLSVLIRETPKTAVEWADKHFYLSPDSSYTEGRWSTAPFQIAPLNSMCCDEIDEVNFQKSARVGYTKLLTIAIAYFVQHRRRNGIVWQPDDGARDSFSKKHIDSMIRDTKPVLDLFPWFGKKHKNNVIEAKTFSNYRTVYLLGGKAAKNYREKSVDFVVYDELSKFDNDIEGEGDPLTLGDKRLEGSVFRKSIRGSTPGIRGECQMTTASETVDYYFRRFIPCVHCGEHQILKFGGKDESFGLKWDQTLTREQQPFSVHYVCEVCGKPFHYSDYVNQDQHGYYETESGVRTYDGLTFFDADGTKRLPPLAITYEIWSAYSHFSPWSRIVTDWLKIKGKPEKLKAFVNTTLGEAWEPKGEQVEHEILYKRREHYAAEVPGMAVVLTCSVDVQDDRLEVAVEGWGEGEENFKIDLDILRGDPAQPEIWDKLDEKLNQKYLHESGVRLSIACTAIDTGGHYTQQVYKFCKSREIRRVYAIKGRAGDSLPIASRPSKNNIGKVNLYTIGVDTAKETVYARLRHTTDNALGFGPGTVHFPVASLFDEEYFKQLTAEKRIKSTNRSGHVTRVWKKKRDRNEALDLAVYNLAALNILNPNFKKLSENLANKAKPEEVEAVTTVAQDIQKERKKKIKRRNTRNFAKSWQ